MSALVVCFVAIQILIGAPFGQGVHLSSNHAIQKRHTSARDHAYSASMEGTRSVHDAGTTVVQTVRASSPTVMQSAYAVPAVATSPSTGLVRTIQSDRAVVTDASSPGHRSYSVRTFGSPQTSQFRTVQTSPDYYRQNQVTGAGVVRTGHGPGVIETVDTFNPNAFRSAYADSSVVQTVDSSSAGVVRNAYGTPSVVQTVHNSASSPTVYQTVRSSPAVVRAAEPALFHTAYASPSPAVVQQLQTVRSVQSSPAAIVHNTYSAPNVVRTLQPAAFQIDPNAPALVNTIQSAPQTVVQTVRNTSPVVRTQQYSDQPIKQTVRNAYPVVRTQQYSPQTVVQAFNNNPSVVRTFQSIPQTVREVPVGLRTFQSIPQTVVQTVRATPAHTSYSTSSLNPLATGNVVVTPGTYVTRSGPTAGYAFVSSSTRTSPAAAVRASHAQVYAVPLTAGGSSQHFAQDEIGQYSYGYSNPNSAKQETRTADGVVLGSYSYRDAYGIQQKVNYVSDAFGFRVIGTNIPEAQSVQSPPASYSLQTEVPVATAVDAAW